MTLSEDVTEESLGELLLINNSELAEYHTGAPALEFLVALEKKEREYRSSQEYQMENSDGSHERNPLEFEKFHL